MSEFKERAALQTENKADADPVLTDGAKQKKRRRRAGKRKLKKRYIALGLVVVLALGGFVYSNATSGSAAVPVTCIAAATGDVEENISASGKVQSANAKTYFAPAGAKIAELNVSVGDKVSAGDLLLTFDTAELEQNKQKADLEASQAANSYRSAMQESDENQNEYSDATIGLDELKQMKTNQEQYVQGLKYELEDDTAEKKEALKEWSTQLQKELDYQNRKLAEKQASGRDTESTQEVIENVQGQLYDVQNELEMLDDDENLKQKQRQIDLEEKKLSDMEEEISRRESRQTSSESGILNGYARAEKEISVETANLSAKQAAEDLQAAQQGVTAEFGGIVTEVTAVEGASVTEGAQLFTVESDQEVKVTVELSKYDLEKVKEGQEAEVTVAGATYRGKVEKINRMAENNAQNTPVVKADIRIENPDGNLFLGVEGKASIHTAKAEGTVLVPYEAVNTDQDGDFCYLVKEGVIVRQDVVTGISNDTDVEIKEGIQAGDTVVTATSMNLTEGMQVVPIIQ